MPLPDLDVLAEGDLPTGQHWILKAGGTSADDFYTFLETIHLDGHRDEGGMGGPPLYPGSLMNTGGRTLERNQRSSWPGWKRLSPFAVSKDSSTAHRRPTTRTSSRSGTTSGE
ncbi:MAG: hypothetical protein QOG05_4324 [Streptosporangiaceae bacterium]|jgi:hypothetical protein|nr:hypothetical protein [Streptosporangiaceae bacterium]